MFTTDGMINPAKLNAVPITIAPAGSESKENQTITFSPIPNQIQSSQVSLTAMASSGLPVNFTVGSGPAVITGDTLLSFTGTGTVSIVASQAGDTNWNAAVPVINRFNVTAVFDKTDQTITFP